MYQDVKVTQIDTRCETSSSCSPMPRGDSHSLRKGVLRCYTVCRDQDPTNAWIFEFSLNSLDSFVFFMYFHVFSPCKNHCKNRCKSESDLISRWPGSWSLRFLRLLGSLGSLCPFLLPRGPDLCSFGLIWFHLPNSSFIWFHLISSYDPITILSQLSDTCWDSQRLKGQECKAM